MSFTSLTLAHGGGGFRTERLLREVIFPGVRPGRKPAMDDSAILPDTAGGRLAFTTDSFIVSPLFFPGGDIGRLAVAGTVNDLAVVGAKPLYLSLGLILEEGLAIETLKAVCESIHATADEAGVEIVTGDTKVVERGKGDGCYINTAGIGRVLIEPPPSLSRARPGDALIVTGMLGDHGAAVMARRESLALDSPVRSDAAPLNRMLNALVEQFGPAIHALKDPTRGGLAMACHDIAEASTVQIEMDEAALRVRPEVQGICDLLGFDVLEVANEGKAVVVCEAAAARAVVEFLRRCDHGHQASLAGRIVESDQPLVVLKTRIGGERLVAKPAGEILPRIC
ncbi:MAG: hydrogenase expression/formation protein HypE [Candidatus Sumerlaeia bacterium]|nr:hydrogenase expression/formation protein HypE [Candidatus Sumerlaeia bacterium]